MNPEDIRATLARWQKSMQDCDQRMDQLGALVGIVDTALGESVYHVMGSYTKAVADQIGWCDDTLSAWWTEHQFGERPIQIGFPNEPLQVITTIDQLAELIISDLRRAEEVS